MRRWLPMILLILILSLSPPADAAQFTAPPAPESAQAYMPENTDSFGEALLELFQSALLGIRPELKEALGICLSVVAAVLLVSLLRTLSGGASLVAEMTGTVTIAGLLLFSANAMIALGAETVRELNGYSKLFFPVMTAAMAAQGGITTSAALYVGTAALDSLLGSLIANGLIPMVYVFLALSVANSALGEDILKKMRDMVKNAMSWLLKTVLTVFTTYMSITGVVSGTTDAAALKATKVTISSVVPVVGGILSDASEAVLISAGIAKNAAGIYGILAVLAVVVDPFVTIGIQYLTLKATAAICGIFGSKGMVGLVEDVSSAMGLLLAMTGAACLLLLISTVCFLKGVG